jgi:transposase-like protein
MVRWSNQMSAVGRGTSRIRQGDGDRNMDDSTGHLQCPFCGEYEVDRLFIGSLRLDSCTCQGCGSRWDEDATTGAYRGRGDAESVLAPRPR